MKVYFLLCALIIICSGYSLSKYNDLCFTRHGDYLKHPNDCHKFMRCSNGHAYEFQCPGNLQWHQEVKSCDYAYRSKCELNVGDSTSNKGPSKENTVNFTNSENLNTDMDTNDNFSNSTVLITEAITADTTKFIKMKIVTPKQLLTEQDTVTKTEQSVFLTAGNIPELSATQNDLNSADQMQYNISGLSKIENTVIITEQFIDTLTVDNVADNVLELSAAKYTNADKVIELPTAVSPTKPLTNKVTIFNITELSIAENSNSLAIMFIKNVTAESIPELSAEEYTTNLPEPLLVSSSAFNVPELSIEVNTDHLTHQLLDNTSLDYLPNLSTKENTINLTGNIVHNSANPDNVPELSLQGFVPNLTNKFIDYPIAGKVPELLTTELATTTKSPFPLSYNENKAEILKYLTDPVISPSTTTVYSTTEIVHMQEVMENAKSPKISQDNTIKNSLNSWVLANNVSNSTSKSSYTQPSPDSTTQDPRLPFRATECQGENNRQQFKALKCYQYYQCFAGWAFLLNCHEGWWFQPDMKRCVQIEDNECGY